MDYSIFCETNSERRKKFSSEHHSYSDDRVLIGNWFNERTRKEFEAEEQLKASLRNELPHQKLERYISVLSKPIKLTLNLDGFLHHGDVIRLKWLNSGIKENFYLAALPHHINQNFTFEVPCLATAISDSRVMMRSAFHVFRNNNYTPTQIPLMYGEIITLCTLEETGLRVLNCEPKSFSKAALKSGHLEVTFNEELSSRSLWRVLCVDQTSRRKTEGQYIPSNTDVIISHVATGQNLAFERNAELETAFGSEREVSGHLYINRDQKESSENICQFEAPLISKEDYGKPITLPSCTKYCTANT